MAAFAPSATAVEICRSPPTQSPAAYSPGTFVAPFSSATMRVPSVCTPILRCKVSRRKRYPPRRTRRIPRVCRRLQNAHRSPSAFLQFRQSDAYRRLLHPEARRANGSPFVKTVTDPAVRARICASCAAYSPLPSTATSF